MWTYSGLRLVRAAGSWLFTSRNIENIKVARDRLLWGFWDRDAGVKQKKNWRAFIRLYNNIKPFDIAAFQIKNTGEIHGLGLVKRTYYDDQTPVWPDEIGKNRVLYPWRIEFSSIIFSEKPFTTHYIKIENYVDGYGIGELPEHELRRILESIRKQLGQLNIDLNIS
ncbi:MAG: hypothetical protein OWQ48_02645 [Desulfurococcus sp.]|nr:hypothetical protein [Desulfurococcus sp.]